MVHFPPKWTWRLKNGYKGQKIWPHLMDFTWKWVIFEGLAWPQLTFLELPVPFPGMYLLELRCISPFLPHKLTPDWYRGVRHDPQGTPANHGFWPFLVHFWSILVQYSIVRSSFEVILLFYTLAYEYNVVCYQDLAIYPSYGRIILILCLK